MKRRSFIKIASSASVPLFLNGTQLLAMEKTSIFNAVSNNSDKVLVLIQLGGGNDGLNMLVPLNSYDTLANHRSNIMLPQNSLLGLDDMSAFHPVMTGLKQTFDDGKLAIIQGVAYPDQNRSHFRSTDIWNAGSSAEVFSDTGWLGRHFDAQVTDYPTNYPNDDYPDPFALTIGSFLSETCQGAAANYSLAVGDTEDLARLDEGVVSDVVDDGTYYSVELAFLKNALRQTNAYSDVLIGADAGGNNMADYPENNSLANNLKTVARLISGGLQTKVYVLSLGGFDTHANQTEAGDPTMGDHASLLKSLSDAIRAFQEDIRLLGVEERVVGMTFSEFGRQIKSNLSTGTDHGTAAPLMVFGSCVNPGFIGESIEIPDQIEAGAGMPMQYDYRSVYGSILMDWFDLSEALVKDLLFDDFQYLPIISDGCRSIVSTNNPISTSAGVNNYPNPFSASTRIVFNLSTSGHTKVSVFDSLGKEVSILANQKLNAGQHELYFEGGGLPSGTYFYRIQSGSFQKVKAMTKI